MNNDKGFTLVEMLLVLAVTFALLFVSATFAIQVKERVTFETYLQQFKLLTYEAYSLARRDYTSYYVVCGSNTPHIFTYTNRETLTQLELPSYYRVGCATSRGSTLVFSNYGGLPDNGFVTFTNRETGEEKKYSANFTYGRLSTSQ